MGSISLIFAALAAAATSPRQSHRELKLTSRVDHAPAEESLSYWRYVVDDGLENPEALAAADLDGDGQPEIMVGSEPDVTVHRIGAGGATGTWVRSVAATATETSHVPSSMSARITRARHVSPAPSAFSYHARITFSSLSLIHI